MPSCFPPAGGPVSEIGLPTGEVARRLGVSPVTLRSWERRYGIGPAQRAEGHHRRWTAADIARLEAMCRLTAHGLPPAEAARLAGQAAAEVQDALERPYGGPPPAALASPRPPVRPSGARGPDEGAYGSGPRESGAHGEEDASRQGTSRRATSRQDMSGQGTSGRGAHGTAARAADGPGQDTPRHDPRVPASAAPGGRDPRAAETREGDRRRHARGLIRAADRLDAPTVQELLASALDHWGVEHAWEDVIAPTLRAAGRRWAALGEAYVEVEHLLSWHVAAELRRCAAVVPRTGPVALLAATPGEEHTLPLDAVAAALTARGIAFRMLGASVPPLALAQACRRLGPAAVLLWSQSRATAAPQLAADLQHLPFGVAGARHSPLLLLGGPGWRAAGAPRVAVRPPSLRAAVDHIAAAVGAHGAPVVAARAAARR